MLKASEVGNTLSKAEFRAVVPQLRVDLVNAQYDLRAADFGVLLFVAGDDRIAGNAVVNRINEWMDARFIRTHVLGPLTAEESMRPRYWRLWRDMPAKGRIALMAGGILRLLHENLTGDLPDHEYDRAIEHLETLQEALVADGMLIIKIFLHTPTKVQRKRMRKAASDDEGWRIDQRDWAMLELLEDGEAKLEKLLRRTSVAGAPWVVVEATDARHRDVAVARTILNAITARLAGKPPLGPAVSDELFSPGDRQATVLDAVDLTRTTDRATYAKDLNRLQRELHGLARQARDRGLSSVLAFEGWDAAGKGGAIRRITQALEAGDYRVISTAAPTEEERKYHYLWRFWRDLPPAGRFVIYDRTWYGRVLVERIEGFAEPAEWQRAYDEINDFEDQLVERGFYVAKFWLHISAEEQLARFQARENTPEKAHKITEEDYRNREKWGDYVEAIDQMVVRTSSSEAPWHVVGANDKLTARLEVLEHVTKGLRRALRRLP
ncbi:MAG: polyphosphate:AMP phosphotransferase [Candidatus Nanopelagicales bacterium]|nr:polyphosphate:AMP phosphotransferase [Candidatus Nanopelagicales bacterium]